MGKINKRQKQFRGIASNNQSRINDIEASLKRSKQKKNIRFYITTIIAIGLLFTTFYQAFLNNIQLGLEKKALDDYKEKNSLDFENLRRANEKRFNETAGYIDIGIPKITFDMESNEWVIEVPTKNVGQNPISRYSGNYSFFLSSPMPTDFEVTERENEYTKGKNRIRLTAINFKKAELDKLGKITPVITENPSFNTYQKAIDLGIYITNYIKDEKLSIFIETNLKRDEININDIYYFKIVLEYVDKFTQKTLSTDEFYKFKFVENTLMELPNANIELYYLILHDSNIEKIN